MGNRIGWPHTDTQETQQTPTLYLILGEDALGKHGARRALRVRAAGGRVHEAGRERAGHQQHAAEAARVRVRECARATDRWENEREE